MKRIANPIETSDLCSYGCGNIANYINGSKKLMCCERHNSCPANKKKNSDGLKIAHEKGLIPTDFGGKENRSWRKNKFDANFSYNGKGQHKNCLIYERGHVCEKCKNFDWMGKPITLELDHIDGDNKNNNKENLRLLCPNCHSQTPTWRRGKRKNVFNVQKYSAQEIIDAIKTSKNINQVLTKLDLRYGSVSTIVKVMTEHKVNFMGD